MTTRKSFFKERSISELKNLDLSSKCSGEGLVDSLLRLNKDREGIVLDFDLFPEKLFAKFNVNSPSQLSRKLYKHSFYPNLNFPRTLSSQLKYNSTPMDEVKNIFDRSINKLEENIFIQGYSFRPVHTQNKNLRVVSLVNLLEGSRIFTYSHRVSPISMDLFSNSKSVSFQGAKGIFSVPSRTKKANRYKIELSNLPYSRSNRSLPISLSINSQSILREIPHREFNIGFNSKESKQYNHSIFFYPHHIAAYSFYIRNQIGKRNYEPLLMTPFMLPSLELKDFYMKLCNNVIVRDKTLVKKPNLRKLHLAEKSILLGRFISLNSFDNNFWNFERDGKLSEYNW